MADHKRPKLFTLLIGIDSYSQIPLPDGSYYPHLGGCVRDINQVEQMLKSRLKLPSSQIFKITSSRGKNDKPLETAKNLPTYKNLVKAFKAITAKASSGDQIYIHYSGHGGRSTTMFPSLKGKSGLDESIVPCDIGENGACYLRDVEIAYLLKAMSDKGLIVTLILDSCHSGGATRGREWKLDAGLSLNRAAPRGINSIDTRKPPTESAVADVKDLLNTFKKMPAEATRNMANASSWNLPVPKNCVFIAGCRANEVANEYPFNGMENNGALTYWLIDALNQIGEGYTYKMLYNRVVAKVHAQFTRQTPQIEGDRDREIFGGVQLATTAGVNVVKVDSAKNRVRLNTGLAQGIAKGSQFAIFAADAKDLKDANSSLAIVEIEEPEVTDSWAQIVSGSQAKKIEVGSQAVLLGVGIRMRGRIRLVQKENSSNTALTNLEKLITKDDSSSEAKDKWIRLVRESEEADFQVAVNQFDEFEIWDAVGRVLPNLRPILKASDKTAAAKVISRLVHLTKYRNVRLIDNTNPTSALANKVTAELGILKRGDDGTKEFTALGVPLRALSIGERFCLRVTNLSQKPLNIAVMDLAPDWSISQIYLGGVQKDYELLETGENNILDYEMEAYLPDNYQAGTDTLKVFATVDGTSFSWLELPALDQPAPTRKGVLPQNNLEELMSAFREKNMRNVKPVVNLSASQAAMWTTASVEARVRRDSIAHVPDPALSLLQSAFDQVIAEENGVAKTRSSSGNEEDILRPNLANADIKLITQYALAESRNQLTKSVTLNKKTNEIKVNQKILDEAQQRGVVDTVKYCASLAVGMAKNLWDAKVNGNTALYNQYKTALTKKMGGCDPQYSKAVTQFLEFLKNDGHIPYRTPVNPNDFVIEGRLPEESVIGIVADWGTGQAEALEVLRQVKGYNPNVAIHLGDIYYAGTQYEVENYFYKPWIDILSPQASNILSLAVPGNHDLYAGGKPYFDLIDKFAALNQTSGKPASYFCLRNDDWQIIGLDTALNDRLIGSVTSLEDSEVEWLTHKINTADGRKTILLSHHQLFSANDSFEGKSYNPNLYDDLKDILPKTDLWLWGHEHDLVIFGEFMNLKRGRCIGGSAFPVGNFEMPTAPKNPDVPYNQDVALSKGTAFYQHCYTIIKLKGKSASVLYCEDRDGGRVLFEETL